MIKRSYFMSGVYYQVDEFGNETRYEFSSTATYQSWFEGCLTEIYTEMIEPFEKQHKGRVAATSFYLVK